MVDIGMLAHLLMKELTTTPKPKELLERIVNASSIEGMLVNFGGSGVQQK